MGCVVSAVTVIDFVMYRDRTVSTYTYNHEFSILRIVLNYYASRFNRNYRLPFIADHREMLKVKEKHKLVKDLTVEEFKSFIVALKEICFKEKKWEAIYYVALMQYATYSRVQSAAALHFEDFDFNRKQGFVEQENSMVAS